MIFETLKYQAPRRRRGTAALTVDREEKGLRRAMASQFRFGGGVGRIGQGSVVPRGSDQFFGVVFYAFWFADHVGFNCKQSTLRLWHMACTWRKTSHGYRKLLYLYCDITTPLREK